MHGCHLQWLANNVQVVVDQSIFHDPMEQVLDTDEFWTGEEGDEGECVV